MSFIQKHWRFSLNNIVSAATWSIISVLTYGNLVIYIFECCVEYNKGIHEQTRTIKIEEEKEFVADEDAKANKTNRQFTYSHCLVSLFFSGNVRSSQIKYNICILICVNNMRTTKRFQNLTNMNKGRKKGVCVCVCCLTREKINRPKTFIRK